MSHASSIPAARTVGQPAANPHAPAATPSVQVESSRRPMQSGNVNANPRGLSIAELVLEDLKTHEYKWTDPSFVALLVHRLGNWRMDLPAPVRAPASLLYRAAHQVMIDLWGIDMPYVVPIGRRFRICHHGGVHMGAWSVGDDVTVRHAVTVGVSSVEDNTARSPIVGNGVELGPGAVLLGTIEIGDGAYIGPNAVVLQNVPPGATAMGVPARVTRTKS